MTTFLTRSKSGSPGLGVSGIWPARPASRRRAIDAGTRPESPRRAGAASDLEKPRRGGQPARVGHGMPGFGDLDAPQARAVSVLHDHEAAGDVIAQDLLGGRSHGAARLAGAQEEDAGGLAIEAEVSADERRHVARRQRRFPYGADGVARGHEPSLRRRSPASRSMSSVFGKQNRIFVRPSSGWA